MLNRFGERSDHKQRSAMHKSSNNLLNFPLHSNNEDVEESPSFQLLHEFDIEMTLQNPSMAGEDAEEEKHE